MAVNRAVVMHMDGTEPVVVLRHAMGFAIAERKSRNGDQQADNIERGHSGRGPNPHFAGHRAQHLKIIARPSRSTRVPSRQFTVAYPARVEIPISVLPGGGSFIEWPADVFALISGTDVCHSSVGPPDNVHELFDLSSLLCFGS